MGTYYNYMEWERERRFWTSRPASMIISRRIVGLIQYMLNHQRSDLYAIVNRLCDGNLPTCSPPDLCAVPNPTPPRQEPVPTAYCPPPSYEAPPTGCKEGEAKVGSCCVPAALPPLIKTCPADALPSIAGLCLPGWELGADGCCYKQEPPPQPISRVICIARRHTDPPLPCGTVEMFALAFRKAQGGGSIEQRAYDTIYKRSYKWVDNWAPIFWGIQIRESGNRFWQKLPEGGYLHGLDTGSPYWARGNCPSVYVPVCGGEHPDTLNRYIDLNPDLKRALIEAKNAKESTGIDNNGHCTYTVDNEGRKSMTTPDKHLAVIYEHMIYKGGLGKEGKRTGMSVGCRQTFSNVYTSQILLHHNGFHCAKDENAILRHQWQWMRAGEAAQLDAQWAHAVERSRGLPPNRGNLAAWVRQSHTGTASTNVDKYVANIENNWDKVMAALAAVDVSMSAYADGTTPDACRR